MRSSIGDSGRTSIWFSTRSTPSMSFTTFSASLFSVGRVTWPSSVTVLPSTLIRQVVEHAVVRQHHQFVPHFAADPVLPRCCTLIGAVALPSCPCLSAPATWHGAQASCKCYIPQFRFKLVHIAS